MNYLKRLLEPRIKHALMRKKSILLLGARQSGKSTLLKHLCAPLRYYDLSSPRLRREFEQDPDRLSDEITAMRLSLPSKEPPLIIIDEVQKVPNIIDVAQILIDNQEAKFILTGSSARKLKKREHHDDINLLPGRVIKLQLDALTLLELPGALPKIEKLLLYGQLPHIYLSENEADKEEDLKSYVNIYLEEEIRQEALVRNLGAFSQFLELAAIEAGNTINISKLSQEIGVSVHLINEYFQILEDCLIVDKIMPISSGHTRRRLTKAPKYLFFDLGVRRICAKEGLHLSQKSLGIQFEQFVGIELNRYLRLKNENFKLCYWRDHNGPEIDYVIEMDHEFLPIEVKWTDKPSLSDCKHLLKFLEEYPCKKMCYIVCRVSRKRLLTDRIMALPWQELPSIFFDTTPPS